MATNQREPDEPASRTRAPLKIAAAGAFIVLETISAAGIPALAQTTTPLTQGGAISAQHYQRQQHARSGGGAADPMDDGPVQYPAPTGGSVTPITSVSSAAMRPLSGTISLTGATWSAAAPSTLTWQGSHDLLP